MRRQVDCPFIAYWVFAMSCGAFLLGVRSRLRIGRGRSRSRSRGRSRSRSRDRSRGRGSWRCCWWHTFYWILGFGCWLPVTIVRGWCWLPATVVGFCSAAIVGGWCWLPATIVGFCSAAIVGGWCWLPATITAGAAERGNSEEDCRSCKKKRYLNSGWSKATHWLPPFSSAGVVSTAGPLLSWLQ